MIRVSAQKESLPLRVNTQTLQAIYEVFVLAFAAILGVGFVLLGPDFAKLGFPLELPDIFGKIQYFRPKLFLFELFYLFFFVTNSVFLCFSDFRKEFFLAIKQRWGFGLGISALLFLFGIFRAFPDLSENPILGIRNSAFVWYLPFCFLISVAPVRLQNWDWLFRGISLIVFYFFAKSAIIGFIDGHTWVSWFPVSGLLLPIAWAFYTKSRFYFFPLIILSLAMASSFYTKVQRTSALGIVVCLGLMFLFWPKLWKQYLTRGVLLALFCVISTLIFPHFFRDSNWLKIKTLEQSYTMRGDSGDFNMIDRALQKAETNDQGIEIFRGTMWKDAWDLFLEHPFLGIGFQKQVVHRVYSTSGLFSPNDGSWGNYMQPPIAGPHNSYLNAIARIGILGIFFLVLHLWALKVLIVNKYWGCVALLLGQIIYAGFNVGLEGPVRSFFLLVGIGIAMACIYPTKYQKSNFDGDEKDGIIHG
jgi:O-antigen ligase